MGIISGEIFAGGMHVGTYDVAANKTYFSHANWLGTERLKTDQSGAVAQDCAYNPYGDGESCSTGPIASPIRCAGYERDAETGLDHMWFRYYNPRLGRFMTTDPLSGSIGDPQSLNKFGYTFGDPVNLNDPLGLDPPPPTWCGSGPSAGQCYIDYYRAYADRFIGASSALAGMVQVWLYTGEFSVDGANARGSDLGGFGGAGIPVATGTTGGVLINGNPSLFDFLPQLPQQCDFGPCIGTSQQLLPLGPAIGGSAAANAAARELRSWFTRWTLPGTNWCGPGGGGRTLSDVDEACMQHDLCYDVAGLSARDVIRGIKNADCDRRICEAVGAVAQPQNGIPRVFSILDRVHIFYVRRVFCD